MPDSTATNAASYTTGRDTILALDGFRLAVSRNGLSNRLFEGDDAIAEDA